MINEFKKDTNIYVDMYVHTYIIYMKEDNKRYERSFQYIDRGS